MYKRTVANCRNDKQLKTTSEANATRFVPDNKRTIACFIVTVVALCTLGVGSTGLHMQNVGKNIMSMQGQMESGLLRSSQPNSTDNSQIHQIGAIKDETSEGQVRAMRNSTKIVNADQDKIASATTPPSQPGSLVHWDDELADLRASVWNNRSRVMGMPSNRSHAMGMPLVGISKRRLLPDTAITASWGDSKNPVQGQRNSRMDSIASMFCDSPELPDHNPELSEVSYKPGFWIQWDLGKPTIITSIATKGQRNSKFCVSKYRLRYKQNGVWRSVTTVFSGNSDGDKATMNQIYPVVETRRLRLYPLEWIGQPCLRVELFGYPGPRSARSVADDFDDIDAARGVVGDTAKKSGRVLPAWPRPRPAPPRLAPPRPMSHANYVKTLDGLEGFNGGPPPPLAQPRAKPRPATPRLAPPRAMSPAGFVKTLDGPGGFNVVVRGPPPPLAFPRPRPPRPRPPRPPRPPPDHDIE